MGERKGENSLGMAGREEGLGDNRGGDIGGRLGGMPRKVRSRLGYWDSGCHCGGGLFAEGLGTAGSQRWVARDSA